MVLRRFDFMAEVGPMMLIMIVEPFVANMDNFERIVGRKLILIVLSAIDGVMRFSDELSVLVIEFSLVQIGREVFERVIVNIGIMEIFVQICLMDADIRLVIVDSMLGIVRDLRCNMLASRRSMGNQVLVLDLVFSIFLNWVRHHMW